MTIRVLSSLTAGCACGDRCRPPAAGRPAPVEYARLGEQERTRTRGCDRRPPASRTGHKPSYGRRARTADTIEQGVRAAFREHSGVFTWQ
ncbi:hypothetical protein [Streptomyces sp. NPDC051098]|uniref:hypothetical protein n=1 Tax=Streptomyces sp. NPDC051098 TaxID=3155411 RepID=UPI00342A3232